MKLSIDGVDSESLKDIVDFFGKIGVRNFSISLDDKSDKDAGNNPAEKPGAGFGHPQLKTTTFSHGHNVSSDTDSHGRKRIISPKNNMNDVFDDSYMSPEDMLKMVFSHGHNVSSDTDSHGRKRIISPKNNMNDIFDDSYMSPEDMLKMVDSVNMRRVTKELREIKGIEETAQKSEAEKRKRMSAAGPRKILRSDLTSPRPKPDIKNDNLSIKKNQSSEKDYTFLIKMLEAFGLKKTEGDKRLKSYEYSLIRSCLEKEAELETKKIKHMSEVTKL
jgi:hypothetical protein